MSLRIVAALVALIALSGPPAVGAGLAPALSPTPNQSLALYRAPKVGKPGKLWTGVMANGVFVQKKAFDTGRWNDIAVGRDTMALYDRKSGKLVTGTLKGGVFKRKASRLVAKGYSHMAASCDSLALYRRGSGQLLTAELTSGQSRDHRTTNVGTGYELLEASCDTLFLAQSAPAGSREEWGHLQLGHYVAMAAPRTALWTHLAANRTSFVVYDRPSHSGGWGSLADGIRGNATPSDQFSDWSIIAGVGDDIVFYQSATGLAGDWRLIDGVIVTGFPSATWKQKGLTLIAGGR